MNTEKKYNKKIVASITIQTCTTDPFYFFFFIEIHLWGFTYSCKFGEKISSISERDMRDFLLVIWLASLKLHNNQDFKNILSLFSSNLNANNCYTSRYLPFTGTSYWKVGINPPCKNIQWDLLSFYWLL